MPSRNATDVIEAIRHKKGHCEVIAKNWKLSLSENAFAEMPLYVGKAVTAKEYAYLKHLSDIEAPLAYARRLLVHHSYTVHEMREKIDLRFPECKDTREILGILKKEGFLDDARYAEDYRDAREAAVYGPARIYEELRYQKGVHPDIVDSLTFREEEGQVALLMPILERKYRSLPLRAKKLKIEKAITDRGFDKEIAKKAADQAKEDEKEAKKRFERDAESALRHYARKCEGYELRMRIVRALMAKGYKMEWIEEVLPQ